ncbi:hypothetical protein B0T20DRAFT_404970 [Sordaria brevicollis]|uniref:Transmembrane protein n=1 Tax=Sordaria brevicollis TaxID=83679 RepID=A0AAE0UE03_SORBR|nr:hypothetical protein B0T20DRAFT_404970 [Sordaria brevicollis]
MPFSPASPAIKQPATQEEPNENDPDSESLFSPSQGYSLTAIVDTVLVLVLLTFVTVCFLQWREGKRRQRRREDLERECQAGYVVEVPLEEYGRRTERVDYQDGNGGGSCAGVGGGPGGGRRGMDGDAKGPYKFEEVPVGR